MISREPGGSAVDPLEIQMGYERARPDRPWILANFVSTIDGATVVDGGSTAINDKDDMEMFGAMRAAADFILVGAGTIRAESYGPVALDARRREARLGAGMEETPHLVVVTRSLDLEPSDRVFSDPEQRVTVLTDESAPGDRFEELSEVADVVRLKSTGVEDIVYYLRLARVVLCEGGATLMGQLVAARLIDEMALTVAPMLVAGVSNRVAHGEQAEPPIEMRLDNVLYGDRSLFLRYVRND